MRKVAEHEIPCQQMLRRSHTQIVPSFATQPNDTQSSGIQAAIIKVTRYGHTLPHATAVVTRYRGGAHAYLSLFLNISQHLPAPLCRQKDHQPPHSFLESLQEIGFKRTSPDNAQPQKPGSRIIRLSSVIMIRSSPCSNLRFFRYLVTDLVQHSCPQLSNFQATASRSPNPTRSTTPPTRLLGIKIPQKPARRWQRHKY
jgi:hypothetical protein